MGDIEVNNDNIGELDRCLRAAIKINDREMVKFLLNAGVDPDACYGVAFAMAAAYGRKEILDQLNSAAAAGPRTNPFEFPNIH